MGRSALTMGQIGLVLPICISETIVGLANRRYQVIRVVIRLGRAGMKIPQVEF